MADPPDESDIGATEGERDGGGGPDAVREALIAAASTAWRPRDPRGELRGHPAWYDLDASGRERVFEATRELRELEAALDPEGLSTTARAVLTRIRRGA
jgi:hypothetical protein